MHATAIPKINFREARHPVVTFTGAIGDHLMILPALRALARLFPQSLGWLGLTAPLTDLLGDVPFSQAHTGYINVESGQVVMDLENIASALQGCDLLISLSTWYNPQVNAGLLKPLAGAASLGYHFPFQHVVELDKLTNTFDAAFKVVLRIAPELRLEDFAQPPALKEIHRQKARQLRHTLAACSKVLLVHADTKLEKRWSTQRFVATLDLFLERHPEFEVWVIGTEDLQLHKGRRGQRVHRYFHLSLRQAMALVGEADLFLGVDSCMLHVADLFRVPGVGLFGPTSPVEWGFRFGPHIHLEGRNGQMEDIEPAEALAALETLLATEF